MEYKELLATAFQSLRSNLMRTALTMLGIFIGTGSVILIASVGGSAKQFITSELSQFGTNYFQVAPGHNRIAMLGGGSAPLTMDDVDEIIASGNGNIDIIAPIAFASGTISAGGVSKSVLIYGLTPEAQVMLKPEFIYGEDIKDEDKDSRVIVLGQDLSEEIFGAQTDPVGQYVKIADTKYRVIGVSKSGGSFTGGFFNSSAVAPLDVVSNQIRGDDDLTEVNISVRDPDLLDDTIEEVELLLRESRNISDDEENDFHIVSFRESLGIIETVTGLLTAFIAGVSAISLVVGGVGVMNIMLVSVVERTKEIGLLKAIGAKDEDILVQFLIESAVITFCGGLIGITAGVIIAWIIAIAAGLPVVISYEWIIIATLVSTLVGVLFGLYPARRAANLSPIDALRTE